MKKKILSVVLSAATLVSSFTMMPYVRADEAKTPHYQTKARQMEKLNRGLVAVKTNAGGASVNGVYLSWRLLGDEDLANQAFDIYRGNEKIYTTGVHEATNYVDKNGTAADSYKVVKAGASEDEVNKEPAVTPSSNSFNSNDSASVPNSFTYVDIPIQIPDDVTRIDGIKSSYKRTYDSKDKVYYGGSNDASVGDIDGDGDYELIVKWDPSDSKDPANSGYTGRVYIDAYEIDPNNNGPLWRIDLGQNVPAGAHYTQFIVYDFDSDGKSEIAMQTAPGSKDSSGKYVSEVGDTEEIRNVDNTAVYVGSGGKAQNKNLGPDYITIFDGNGKALRTTAGIPLGDPEQQKAVWGDSNNRAFRYLAGVAYLDGIHPSFIISRGYYDKAVIRAYSWDGNDFSMVWEHDSGSTADPNTMYGQGNHNLSIADIDNDGKDEIVWGSACLDDDGKTVLGNTLLGHGDALHVSDFNNDGVQEAFSVKEKSVGFKEGAQLRVASTGETIWSKAVDGDNGRGVMANIDDEYAAKNPGGLALGWSSAHADAYDLNGNSVGARPSKAGRGDFYNFLVYWDGDLGRELLDADIIQKHSVQNGTKRFYGPNDTYTLSGITTNNGTKRNYSLVADIWGDWREEIIVPVMDANLTDKALRIYTSTIPSEYRLTTLMHDCQYRMAIAWQNVGYNQPPHQSYYIGSAALAEDKNGKKLNYLAPATAFTKVTYDALTPVTGISLSQNSITVEKGKTAVIKAIIEPKDADRKGVDWTSSNENVATVSSGIIKGLSEGTAVIKATTRDGAFTAECKVTVYMNHVTSISVNPENLILGTGITENITAVVEPSNATDSAVIWSSEDESVAVVDQEGNVTAVADSGATYISASTADGGLKASCYVVVYPFEKTDMTGSSEFISENTDANTTVSSTGTSLTIDQKNAAKGVTAYKEFKPFNTEKTELSFMFNTGGIYEGVGIGNWTGREYIYGIQLLDKNDNNILTLSQAHMNTTQTTQSKVIDEESKTAVDDWECTSFVDGGSPFDRNTSIWKAEFEFDYDSDMCHAVITGNAGSGSVYEKTFKLNGANFAKLKYYNEKGTDTALITANPKITDLSYIRTTMFIPKNNIAVTKIDENKADVSFTVTDIYKSIVLIGALYNEGNPVEIKSIYVEKPTVYANLNESFEFSNKINDYDLKMFLWDSFEGVMPITVNDYIAKGEHPAVSKPTQKPQATVSPTIIPTPPQSGVVFETKENFLMKDGGRWIISADSSSSGRGGNGIDIVSETSTDKGGNSSPKLHLMDKAVQYVLNDDELILSGGFRLTYDMFIDTADASYSGRSFRTYFDNVAHPFDRTTGIASKFGNESAFFHMTDIGKKIYTTSAESAVATGSAVSGDTGIELSNTAIAENTWYRVIIEGNLTDGNVSVKYYSHGAAYNETIDTSATEPVISSDACFTEGRSKVIRQIKFMRTAGGDLYYDNIKLEKVN